MTDPVIGRLAPSPTGHLHLGHARSFLLAYWHSKANNGSIVLRIEDLDGDRCKPEFVTAALRDCEWLGLSFSGEPLVQSSRMDDLRQAALQLAERGLAYPCVCSRAEIRAVSAPHSNEHTARYPGTCRGLFRSLEQARAVSGKLAGLRFIVPDAAITVEDGFAEPTAYRVAQDSGDFLILRRDGIPAYQLAVVVDDAYQGVTEVVRGCDLMSSTARQILLQRGLGLNEPRTYHVPLVVDQDGHRLAKRDGAMTLRSLREAGVDPRAVVGWAARSCGCDVPARVSADEVTSLFRLDSVPKAPVRCGPETRRQLLSRST